MNLTAMHIIHIHIYIPRGEPLENKKKKKNTQNKQTKNMTERNQENKSWNNNVNKPKYIFAHHKNLSIKLVPVGDNWNTTTKTQSNDSMRVNVKKMRGKKQQNNFFFLFA